MREAVIVDAVRTPIGKRNGGLSACTPSTCPRSCYRAGGAHGIDPSSSTTCCGAASTRSGDQSQQVGRYAVLAAGWPETFPGPRSTGRAARARGVRLRGAAVMTGQYDLVVAGGVESMRRVPLGSAAPAPPARRTGHRCRPLRRLLLQPGHRRRAHRPAVGLLAAPARRVRRRSHERAAAATDRGAFDGQLVAGARRRRPSSPTRACAAAPRVRRSPSSSPRSPRTG